MSRHRAWQPMTFGARHREMQAERPDKSAGYRLCSMCNYIGRHRA